MRKSSLCSVALVLLVSAPPALAVQPGTSAEAQALQRRLERYVGKAAFADRYVTITPDAEGYRVAMDLSPLMSRLGESGLTMEVSPFEFRMSRRTDGNWDIGGNQPVRVRVVVPAGESGEKVEIEARTNEAPFDAVVSDETGTFLRSSGRVAPMEVRQEDAASVTHSAFGAGEFHSQGRDREPGLVDVTAKQAIESRRDVVVMKPASPATGETAAGLPGFGPTTTTMGAMEMDTSVSGMRAEALQNLWALAVERLESTARDEDAFREELRTALRALGPLWDDLNAAFSARDLKIETGVGSATLARYEQTTTSDGLVRASDHRLAMAFEGLAVVSDILPPAARDLVPRSATLNLAATGVDLETPMRILADTIDPELEGLVPDETGGALIDSFIRQPPRLAIEPSRIVGPGYEVTFDLVAHSSDGGYRVVSNISATGLDGVMSKLQAAGTPEAFQAAGVLGLAKGFGRPEADGRTTWTVERPSDGSVKVNGVELVPAPTATP